MDDEKRFLVMVSFVFFSLGYILACVIALSFMVASPNSTEADMIILIIVEFVVLGTTTVIMAIGLFFSRYTVVLKSVNDSKGEEK